MIWPWLMGFSALVTVGALIARDTWAAKTGAIVFCAYALMQVKKMVFPDHELAFVVSAAIWVIAAGAIPRQNGANVFEIRSLLALVGLCYFWGRLMGEAAALGSTPHVVSDLLAIVAMVLIGSNFVLGLVDKLVDGASDMGLASDRSRGAYRVSDNSPMQETEKHPEISLLVKR